MGESELTAKAVPADEAELYAQQDVAHEALLKVNRELAGQDLAAAHDQWVQDYGHLFFWCCGSPVFGGRDSEDYYIKYDWERGLPEGGTAMLHGL